MLQKNLYIRLQPDNCMELQCRMLLGMTHYCIVGDESTRAIQKAARYRKRRREIYVR